jgi:hypothetical protein
MDCYGIPGRRILSRFGMSKIGRHEGKRLLILLVGQDTAF